MMIHMLTMTALPAVVPGDCLWATHTMPDHMDWARVRSRFIETLHPDEGDMMVNIQLQACEGTCVRLTVYNPFTLALVQRKHVQQLLSLWQELRPNVTQVLVRKRGLKGQPPPTVHATPPEPEVLPPEPAPAPAAEPETVLKAGAEWCLPTFLQAVDLMPDNRWTPMFDQGLNIRFIQRIMARFFRLELKELTGMRRTNYHSVARQVTFLICKQLLDGLSLPELGRRFGDRDHSTVLYSLRKMDYHYRLTPRFRAMVDALKTLILHAATPVATRGELELALPAPAEIVQLFPRTAAMSQIYRKVA